MLKTAGTLIGTISGILSPQQADDASQDFFIQKRVQYSENDFLNDILEPIRKQKHTQGLNGSVFNTINDGIIDAFIDMLESPQLDNVVRLEKAWFGKWGEAFQLNPSINLSEKIIKFINSKLISEKWIKNLSVQGFIETNIFPEISQFMDKLVSDAKINKLIDYDNFDKKISKKKIETLNIFNLKESDNFSGVNSLNNIRSKCVKFLEEYFLKVPLLLPDKPYLNIDGDKFSSDMDSNIENEFRNTNLVNLLAEASLEKAKNELKGILDSAPENISSDSRFLDVLSSFKNDTPFVFDEELFKNYSNAIENWIFKWKNILNIKQEIVKDNALSEFKIVFTLSIKGDLIIFKKDNNNGFPEFKLDSNKITPNEVKSKSMKFQNYLYSTNSLEQFLLLEDNCVVSEESYLKLLNSLSKDEGDTLKDLSLDDLKKISSSIFKNQQNINSFIENIKSKLKSEYSQNGIDSSNLKLSFQLKKQEENGKSYIYIKAFIEDDNIDGLSTLDWDNLNTSNLEKNEIEAKFHEADNLNKEKVLDFKIPLENKAETATKELYSYFEVETGSQKTVYKNDLANFHVGDEFPLEFLEKIYSKNGFISLKQFLSDFNKRYSLLDDNLKKRFDIHFFVKEINDKFVLRYELTDLENKNILITKYDEGHNLDNISISISKFNSPLDKYLKKLGEMNIKIRDSFNTETFCKSFAENKILSIKDIEEIFPEFENIKNEAIKEKEPIYIEIEKNNSLRWNDLKKCLEQKFVLSFDGKDGSKTSMDFWRAISKTFKNSADKELIDNKLKEIEELALDTKTKIKTMGLPDSDLENILKEINMKLDFLKAFPGKTNEEVLSNSKKFGEFLLAKLSDAAVDKKNEVYQLIKNNFNGDIPPEIENLFEQQISAFADILKNHPELLEDSDKLNSFLNLVKNLDASKFIHTTKIMKKNTKIGLSVLGGILGFGGFLGIGNSVKIATTNRKITRSGNRSMKIRSGKKLSILSILIGMASIIGSISTFIYLFIAQGGL